MVFDADQVTAEVAEGIEKIQNASNLEELKSWIRKGKCVLKY